MIFLSAGIPVTADDFKAYQNADVIAIREAVKALATVVVPKTVLVWGGHPAITPVIRFALQHADVNMQEHVILYQSRYFEKIFPEENSSFEKVILTKDMGSRPDSLALMRRHMINDHRFKAAIFIGGLSGVKDEYELFKARYPRVKLFPVASTGGTAAQIFDLAAQKYDPRLATEYAYQALFTNLLKKLI